MTLKDRFDIRTWSKKIYDILLQQIKQNYSRTSDIFLLNQRLKHLEQIINIFDRCLPEVEKISENDKYNDCASYVHRINQILLDVLKDEGFEVEAKISHDDRQILDSLIEVVKQLANTGAVEIDNDSVYQDNLSIAQFIYAALFSWYVFIPFCLQDIYYMFNNLVAANNTGIEKSTTNTITIAEQSLVYIDTFMGECFRPLDICADILSTEY